MEKKEDVEVHNLAPLVPFISPSLRKEILDLFIRRHGEKEIEERAGKISSLRRNDKTFAKLLSIYLEDEELRDLIWRGYTEFGWICRDLGISESEDKKRNLMEGLDDKSKAILWHLYQKRHADIKELSGAVSASHYEILSRLKEVIIPESEKIMGKPIVKFEKSRIDRVSGEKVLFSWWIEDEVPIIKDGNIELFDEKDRIVMIADLPGLMLSNPIGISANYNNGILEVVLKKEVEYEKRR
jgi:hypothetical protein